jgi:hypothetical protein
MNTKTQVTDDTAPGTVVVRETGRGQFQRGVISGPHRLLADEAASVGRLDSGPGPYEFLLAALGACTSMTQCWRNYDAAHAMSYLKGRNSSGAGAPRVG